MNKNKKAASIPQATPPAKNPEIFIKVFFILVILFLYGKTLTYNFALDDELFIINSPKVNAGIKGIGEAFTKGSLDHFAGSNFQMYRPVQVTVFCIEQQFFGLNPKGFHFVNLVLYCLLSLVVYSLLGKLLPKLNIWYRAMIVLLFVVHPIHAEVVANIKSQDELLSALFNLSALAFLFKYQADKTHFKYMVYAVLCYLLGLFSKESSFAFVVIFPISLFLLHKDSIVESLKKSVPFFVAGIFFLICRQAVVSGAANNNETTPMENVLYAAKGWQQVIGTKLEIGFYYLKMMVCPHPMSWDYSFNQIPVMSVTDSIPIISLVCFLLIGLLVVIHFKKRPEIAFGLLFFVILSVPTASVFFPNGATFGDRFLFLPSFGFIVALVFLVLWMLRNNSEDKAPANNYVLFGAALVCLAACFVTTARVPDWKNNYTLFKSGAAGSPNSSRTNMGLGSLYMDKAQASTDTKERMAYVDSAVAYLGKSIKIYPQNHTSSYKLGLIYTVLNKNEQAKKFYRQSIASNPSNVQALNNLGTIYNTSNQFDSAYYFYEKAYGLGNPNDMTLANISIAAFNKGLNDKAIFYAEESINKGMRNAKVYNVLYNAYLKAGNTEKAQQYKVLEEMSNK